MAPARPLSCSKRAASRCSTSSCWWLWRMARDCADRSASCIFSVKRLGSMQHLCEITETDDSGARTAETRCVTPLDCRYSSKTTSWRTTALLHRRIEGLQAALTTDHYTAPHGQFLANLVMTVVALVNVVEDESPRERAEQRGHVHLIDLLE